MRRQVAQLAGFVDQAGLFRTLFAITNKFHSRFSLEWTDQLNSFMEQGGGKFNRRLSPVAALLPLILRARQKAGVSNDGRGRKRGLHGSRRAKTRSSP
ncbi:hypothetical protein [Bradyrhizobium sp. LM6.9]